jgi:hypothetical protein
MICEGILDAHSVHHMKWPMLHSKISNIVAHLELITQIVCYWQYIVCKIEKCIYRQHPMICEGILDAHSVHHTKWPMLHSKISNIVAHLEL